MVMRDAPCSHEWLHAHEYTGESHKMKSIANKVAYIIGQWNKHNSGSLIKYSSYNIIDFS